MFPNRPKSLLRLKIIYYLKHCAKFIASSRYRELEKIRRTPRYTRISTTLLETPLLIADGLSFFYAYHDIFSQEIYAFHTKKRKPVILDGGANIGLSIIYFKKLYPECTITAFEPDPIIFDILQQNIAAFGYRDVDLINKALWTSDTLVDFWKEGADGGRILRHLEPKSADNIQISAARLRNYMLTRQIDFLKLDIEGAEVDVILDCADCLEQIEYLFIEYHSFAAQEQRLDELLHVVRKAGFRIHVHNQFAAPRPFLEHPSYLGMDMNLNIFGYREPAIAE